MWSDRGLSVFLNESSLVNWKSLFRIIKVWTLKNMKRRVFGLSSKLEEFDLPLPPNIVSWLIRKESHEWFNSYPGNLAVGGTLSPFMETFFYCQWLFLIGFVSFSYFFVEVYGILFCSEPTFIFDDIRQYGLTSFYGCVPFINLMLVLDLVGASH